MGTVWEDEQSHTCSSCSTSVSCCVQSTRTHAQCYTSSSCVLLRAVHTHARTHAQCYTSSSCVLLRAVHTHARTHSVTLQALVSCCVQSTHTHARTHSVTLQALSSTPTNPHSCFAWSYKALAMLVDCMWSFGWWLEGGGEDSHKACNLFDN